MEIHALADHVAVLPTLIDWYLSEWEPFYGVDGPGDARADLESRCNRDKIPIGLVAVDGGQVYGTVALDLDLTTDLMPSVVGLLVGANYRRKGIATALIDSAEDTARRLGCERLYMSTTILGDLLQRRRWRLVGEVEFLNSNPGSVFKCDL